MAKPKKKGLFIVLEGLDGSGTTTQGQLLARRLEEQGEAAHFTTEPSSGPIGSQIRMMLAGRLVGYRGAPWDRRSLALLFAADRLDHLACVIRPKVEQGIHVICDRYLLSSLAYQSLDNPRGWVAELNRFAAAPDLTFFLRIQAAKALQRRQEASPGEGELFETLPQQQRIQRNYERAIEELGVKQRVRIVDGAASIDEVAASIWSQVEARLRRRR